ncbi:MAG: ribonuclease H-like domain-containing protein [Clostridia bacterium]|jgi:hypothetical protein|nr:ribonuclease H-like domain-containing protein [Clostridia bacterium]
MYLTVRIWCDGSLRRTKIEGTNKNPRAAFAAWYTDTGHYWYDQIYANKSSDAELSAVMVGLFWAWQQGFDKILIHTDDQTIPGNLYGPNEGKALGDLRALIESCAAEVKIIHIHRSQNGQAHRLCNLAYQEYLTDNRFPRKIKRKWSYRSLNALKEAQSQGYIKEVKLFNEEISIDDKASRMVGL